MEFHDIVQETGIKTISKKKKCKEANVCSKCLSEEALQIAEKRRETNSKGEKERYINIPSRKSETLREHFMQRWVR